MKNIILSIAVVSLLGVNELSAQQLSRTPVGLVTSTLSVMSPGRLPVLLENTSKITNVQIAGFVHSVAADGSWMVINSGSTHNDFVVVKRKTGAFAFTANLVGKTVSAQGDVVKKQLSTAEKQEFIGSSVTDAPTNVFEIESTGYYIYE